MICNCAATFFLLDFFFFKQKTAYEISACLVGSEMCIRDSYKRFLENKMREKWSLTGTPINIYIRQK